ncbi:MAG: hypothetical protein EXR95_05805 [Gemmatimonadetes bacterium]|nr:hypothetical protein [Gemmatimonadota bacterium]
MGEHTVAIAHSGGRAVAAATVGPARLGIAIERRCGVSASEGRLFSGPAEAGLPVDDPAVVRALKKASWDALGLPGEAALDELELRFSESGRMLGLHLDGIGVRAVGAVALPWAGWIAAVVSMEGVS